MGNNILAKGNEIFGNKKMYFLFGGSIVAVIILISFLLINYFGSNPVETGQKVIQDTSESAENLTESATQGTLPEIDSNPLKKAPDTNPVSKTNPYSNVKTNPFE